MKYPVVGNTFSLGDPRYAVLEVAGQSSQEKLKGDLKAHQEGRTDYATFSRQAAEAGVEKWMVDLVKMTCTYHDKQGKELLTEKIPE